MQQGEKELGGAVPGLPSGQMQGRCTPLVCRARWSTTLLAPLHLFCTTRLLSHCLHACRALMLVRCVLHRICVHALLPVKL